MTTTAIGTDPNWVRNYRSADTEDGEWVFTGHHFIARNTDGFERGSRYDDASLDTFTIAMYEPVQVSELAVNDVIVTLGWDCTGYDFLGTAKYTRRQERDNSYVIDSVTVEQRDNCLDGDGALVTADRYVLTVLDTRDDEPARISHGFKPTDLVLRKVA